MWQCMYIHNYQIALKRFLLTPQEKNFESWFFFKDFKRKNCETLDSLY